MYSKEAEEMLKKNGAKIGDSLEVLSKKGKFEGILMPRPEVGDLSTLILKLKNGYNVGVKLENIDELTVVGAAKRELNVRKATVKARKDLEKIGMIYTGGTIGSKIDYVTGGVHMLAKPEELIGEVPELSEIANIDIHESMSIASEDMTYKEWTKLAQETAKMLNNGVRGIVVTHGTDTMHYTAAALSFMLKDLNAPVVFTGSQRSSDRGSSDAFMNLICSSQIATKSDVAEVGICMHSTTSDDHNILIRGTKARKMHTSRRDAFRAINNDPICKVDIRGHIDYLSNYARIDPGSKKKVSALTGFEPKVALIKTHPNSDPEVIDFYVAKKYKGFIIEGTGLGHVPVSPSIKEYSWIDHVKKAVDSGAIVGITSQCLNGRVNENVYRNLRLLKEAGAIFCEDMLPETAYVKLGFLLGNYSKAQSEKLLSENLVGEITNRTELTFEIQ